MNDEKKEQEIEQKKEEFQKLNEELKQSLEQLREAEDSLKGKSGEMAMLFRRRDQYDSLEAKYGRLVEQMDALADRKAYATSQAQVEAIEKELDLKMTALTDIVIKQEALEKDIRYLVGFVMSNKNFNKSLLFRNIRELLKQNPEVKLGQIEKEAGCQPGYMSRLEKAGNTSDPSAEFIVTAAKLLGVSVDTLINSKIGGITSTEEYLLHFIDCLIDDTRAGILKWNRETVKALHRIEPLFDIDIDSDDTTHPLFRREVIDTIVGSEGKASYDSYFMPDEVIDTAGDCFNAELSGTSASIYVMSCENLEELEGEDQVFLEMYIVNGTSIEPVCCSVLANDMIKEKMEVLYSEIEIYLTHIHLDTSTISLMGLYLSNRDKSK